MDKCIHIDMDCFFAAIEVRENPSLSGLPVVVGGDGRRGVVCAANYEARAFGCRSAMPGYKARQLCPQLVMLPVRYELYEEVSGQIYEILRRFTKEIEPLSLDEAYLDLSHWKSRGSSIAWEIRAEIFEETGLNASAGIAPNKMLAKIASDWNKPNGQFEIKSEDIDAFMEELPVSKLWGVGARMQERLLGIRVKTCGDLQAFDKIALTQRFGKWGLDLFDLCRGIDTRMVKSKKWRKSLSKEHTFVENISRIQDLVPTLKAMKAEIVSILENRSKDKLVRSLVIKLKFEDFTQTTAERAHSEADESIYLSLLADAWQRGAGKSVRLLGVGVKFVGEREHLQMDLFDS